MENDYVLNGLVKRRADLMADLATAQERVQSLHHDLAALDTVIRQFAPDYPCGQHPPAQPRVATF